ncbi:MAG: hypothetical protein HY812_19535 [Planctomycetes bacterium]|nr:hypothetical protein [Planctomycetota bacterium]
MRVLQETPPWDWPEDAGRMLASVLRDREAAGADRVLAAELAGEFSVIDDDLAKTLLSIVQDGAETDELRGPAAISLGPVLEQSDSADFEDADDAVISQETFLGIQSSLGALYRDAGVPKEVRRSILEASVRAPQEWHAEAIRAAHASGDEKWVLTAVFCMRFARGFEREILAALESDDRGVCYQAICAAGVWCVDDAWPRVAALLASAKTEKKLLLAAIEAAASIRPQQAEEVLGHIGGSADEDIVEAVEEALFMAAATGDDEGEDDEGLRY